MLRAVLASGLFALAATQAAPVAAQGQPSDPVAATVNGEAIHVSEVAALRRYLPEQLQQVPTAAIFPQLLDQLVSRKLVAQAAREKGMLNDDEVKGRIQFATEGVLHEIYLTRAIEATLTDVRLRDAYNRMIAAAPRNEEVRARHILVKTEKEANEVIAELNGGANFEVLAKKRSTGPSGKAGGDLGYFKRGEMVPEFSDAAFALKNGETTKAPVKTQFGWHVIMVVDRRESAPPAFDDMREELRNQEAQQEVKKILADLHKVAKIETHEDVFPKPPAPAPAPAAAPSPGGIQRVP